MRDSPNDLNLAVAYQLGWTGELTGTLVFFVPLALLGFPPGAVIGVLALNLVYQFWLHTRWIPKLGWFEWLFNTPSHHRVHHACNREYLGPDGMGANYGGILIIFDRCFGTFVAERAAVPCRYGLLKRLSSYNPRYVALHEWIAMGRDVAAARSWRDRFQYVFGPPDWRPSSESASQRLDRHALDDAAEEDDLRVRQAYGTNYDRLKTLKRKCDPTNLLRHNSNINPKAIPSPTRDGVTVSVNETQHYARDYRRPSLSDPSNQLPNLLSALTFRRVAGSGYPARYLADAPDSVGHLRNAVSRAYLSRVGGEEPALGPFCFGEPPIESGQR